MLTVDELLAKYVRACLRWPYAVSAKRPYALTRMRSRAAANQIPRCLLRSAQALHRQPLRFARCDAGHQCQGARNLVQKPLVSCPRCADAGMTVPGQFWEPPFHSMAVLQTCQGAVVLAGPAAYVGMSQRVALRSRACKREQFCRSQYLGCAVEIDQVHGAGRELSNDRACYA